MAGARCETAGASKSSAWPAYTGRDEASSTGCSAGTARRIVKPGQVFNRIHVEDIAERSGCAIGATGRTDLQRRAMTSRRLRGCRRLRSGAPGRADRRPTLPFDDADLTPMARSFYAECKRVSNAAHQDRSRRRAGLSDLSRRLERHCPSDGLRRFNRHSSDVRFPDEIVTHHLLLREQD